MRRYRLFLFMVVCSVLLGGVWLLPIEGQVIVVGDQRAPALLWPQLRSEPVAPRAGQTVTLWATDTTPWAHVLLTVDDQPLSASEPTRAANTWTWQWTFAMPQTGSATLVFYHDCHTGCVERGRLALGAGEVRAPSSAVPTKLGVVFASPARDWHGRSGWNVELTYARLAEQTAWGADALAARVQQATAQGLRVLVRVDFAPGQTLPPANDQLALDEYLGYVQRLARDARLRGVYGYIIGSGFNALDSNALAKERAITPQWYARVFNGFGESVSRANNVVQVMRAENAQTRVLVGPVRPWNADQNGERRFTMDVPWLNYMHTLVALLDAGARAKSAAGIALAAPDGFAVNAPARLSAAELAGRSAADEPRLDLRRREWGEAQAGFRVYRDWLTIINTYSTTRGLPVFINAANTFAPDEGVAPAQNYTRGWLTSALDVVNQEPQVLALCWFLDEDRSGDPRWDHFSLTKRLGRMIDAAEEFDGLLQRGK